MTTAELKTELAAMKGEFYLKAGGLIRHRRLRDAYGQSACPICALAIKRGETHIGNHRAAVVGACLGFTGYGRIIQAADHPGHYFRDELEELLGIQRKDV